MSTRPVIAALALSVVLAACGLERVTGTTVEYPVEGVVTAGPVCPVMQDPPNPDCADRPVAGARLWILDGAGSRIIEIISDSDGRFRLSLPAGHYTVQPRPVEGLLGTAPPQEFAAGPGLGAPVAVAYDTGIR